jgi:hypothetical protein
MIRVFGFGMMLLVLAPPLVLGQKGKNGNVIDGTPAEYAQLKTEMARAGSVVGKLASVDTGSDAKSFVLDIQYFYPVPSNYNGNLYQRNPGGGYRLLNNTGANYQSQINNLLAKQQTYMMKKNPAKYQQQIQQIAVQIQNLQMKLLNLQTQQMMTMNRLFNQAAAAAVASTKLASGYKEFSMETVDNFLVRRLNPPFEYDDKGNIKKYTKEELDKMKGKDKNVVGYEAKVEDLQAGQIVRVYPAKPKAKPKDDNAPKADKNDDNNKDKIAADMPPDPPQVRLILILADADANVPDNPPPKKKKKQ